MPRVTRDTELEHVLAARAEFESSSAWRRSRKGNCWRTWEGMTLTIFKRDDGFFGWCVASADDRRFSSGGYELEGDAMSALGSELGVGEF